MTSRMSLADLKLVPAAYNGAQRVAVLEEAGRIRTAWAEVPRPGPDELRIRIKWVGICGSDLEAFRGSRQAEFLSVPARLGHEVAGVVDEIGERVEGIRAGDQVACRYVWGAFAEYIVCRPFNVKVLPANFPLRDASLIEVLPGVIHAAEIGRIDQSKNVLITGQGVSGLVLTQVIRYYSPRALAVTDLRQRNLDLAKRYGATHTYLIPDAEMPTMLAAAGDFPEGFDVVIPCLLDGDGMIDAIDCAALGGRVVMYGCIGLTRRPVDFFKVHRKRLDIFSTEPKRDIDMRRYFEESVRMVCDGLVNTSEMVTHEVPLSRIEEAFELRNQHEAIHVLVDCEA